MLNKASGEVKPDSNEIDRVEAGDLQEKIQDLGERYKIDEALAVIERVGDAEQRFEELLHIAGFAFEGPKQDDPEPNGDKEQVSKILSRARDALNSMSEGDAIEDRLKELAVASFRYNNQDVAEKCMTEIKQKIDSITAPRQRVQELKYFAGIYLAGSKKEQAKAVLAEATELCSKIGDEQERHELLEEISEMQPDL